MIHGLLGVVGRHLQHLRIYGDSEACYEPGGRAGEQRASNVHSRPAAVPAAGGRGAGNAVGPQHPQAQLMLALTSCSNTPSAAPHTAWLALVPELTSLEVENAADWTIGLSHFPAGWLGGRACGGPGGWVSVPRRACATLA